MQDTLNVAVPAEIFSRIDALAAKLGVAAEHLWQVLIAQAGVEVFKVLLMVAITAVAAVIYIVAFRWFLKTHSSSLWRETESYKDWEDEGKIKERLSGILDEYEILVGVLWVAFGVFGLILIGCASQTILYTTNLPTLIMNPEYWALQRVMELLP